MYDKTDPNERGKAATANCSGKSIQSWTRDDRTQRENVGALCCCIQVVWKAPPRRPGDRVTDLKGNKGKEGELYKLIPRGQRRGGHQRQMRFHFSPSRSESLLAVICQEMGRFADSVRSSAGRQFIGIFFGPEKGPIFAQKPARSAICKGRIQVWRFRVPIQ